MKPEVQTIDMTLQYDAFADDLLAERTPRTMIIVGASRIDALLSNTLAAYLIPKRAKAKDSDELLEGDRPLSTFSAKIKLCYRLGIIDESLCKILEVFRQLRNICAHSVTFDATKPPARDHLSNLQIQVGNRKSYSWIKERYYDNRALSKPEELQCAILTLCALLEAINKRTARTTGVESTLTISKR